MAHLATLRDDCGLVNYTIPVKHYTIRHCQLQNNRQIAPHRILLNTIQRCSKLSKLSIAEQIFESNCDWLMKIMSGVFHQKETEGDVGATVTAPAPVAGFLSSKCCRGGDHASGVWVRRWILKIQMREKMLERYNFRNGAEEETRGWCRRLG